MRDSHNYAMAILMMLSAKIALTKVLSASKNLRPKLFREYEIAR